MQSRRIYQKVELVYNFCLKTTFHHSDAEPQRKELADNENVLKKEIWRGLSAHIF